MLTKFRLYSLGFLTEPQGFVGRDYVVVLKIRILDCIDTEGKRGENMLDTALIQVIFYFFFLLGQPFGRMSTGASQVFRSVLSSYFFRFPLSSLKEAARGFSQL
jgi:hypothetical protein